MCHVAAAQRFIVAGNYRYTRPDQLNSVALEKATWMQDHREQREVIIRATLSGLGFDLLRTPRGFTVIDRRAALDLPMGPLLPTTDASLEEITKLFSLKL
jgi:hypothetical protein